MRCSGRNLACCCPEPESASARAGPVPKRIATMPAIMEMRWAIGFMAKTGIRTPCGQQIPQPRKERNSRKRCKASPTPGLFAFRVFCVFRGCARISAHSLPPARWGGEWNLPNEDGSTVLSPKVRSNCGLADTCRFGILRSSHSPPMKIALPILFLTTFVSGGLLAADRLVDTTIRPGTNAVQTLWNTVPGRVYRVQSTTNLTRHQLLVECPARHAYRHQQRPLANLRHGHVCTLLPRGSGGHRRPGGLSHRAGGWRNCCEPFGHVERVGCGTTRALPPTPSR